MASPLQILGDIAGGLSTIGAQGSGGAYEGVLEGEALKRRFSASDADTNLRILQGTLMQQQLGPQFHTDSQGRTFLIRPGQPPQFWGFAPQRPPTDLERAHTDYYRAAAEGKLLGPADKGERGPTKASVEGEILSEYVKRLMTQGPQAAQQWLKEAYRPIIEAGQKEAAEPKPRAPIHARPGDVILDPESYKPIYTAPPRPSGAGAGEYTTTVEGEKLTPRKQLKEDGEEVKGLNAALDPTAKSNVVLEIEGDFQKNGSNFRVPGQYVKLPKSGRFVRKEDVIADRLLEDFGVEVKVRWDPVKNRFVVVDAWKPAESQPTSRTTTRTKGRPPTARSEPDDDR